MSLERLINYAQNDWNLRIKIIPSLWSFAHGHPRAYYKPFDRMIEIESTGMGAETVFVLAHELGHAMLEQCCGHEWRARSRWSCSHKYQSIVARRHIIMIEKRAWRWAAGLLRGLNIQYNRQAFAKYASACLKTYKYDKNGVDRTTWCSEE